MQSSPIFFVIILFANFLHAKDIFAPVIQVNEMIIKKIAIVKNYRFFADQNLSQIFHLLIKKSCQYVVRDLENGALSL